MYLIEDKVIFLHFPKASGTFIKRNTLCKILKPIIRHVGINHLPEEYYKYPIFGIIRNPFSFYVSFYNYFRNNKRLNSPTKEILFCKYFIEDENVDMNDFKKMKEDFNKHLQLLITNGMEHEIKIKNYNCGFFSRLFQFIFIKTIDNPIEIPEITIIKMEEYDKVNIFLSKNNITQITSNTKINSGNHRHYRHYYTPETIKLVEKYDKNILKKYNYHF